jgi:hypothetical protein
VEATQDAVKEILGHYQALAQHFERFASISLPNHKLASYVNLVFPSPKRKPKQTDRSFREALAHNQELRDTSARLAVEGHGNDQPAIRGTLWAAYNGVAQLVDHHLAYDTPCQRLESVCLGDGQRTKQRAFDVALDFSKN